MGSTRSRPWWRTAARSDGVGLAVPMSMPRYTCMASTATISVPATASAAAIATSDLPEAVGPTTTTGARPISDGDDHGDAGAVGRLGDDLAQLPGEVVGSGAGDLDRRVRAGAQRLRRGEVHEAVLRRARCDDRRVLLARALDEDLLDPSDAGPVGGQRTSLDHHAQAAEALTADRRVDEAVAHRRRLGARPRREDEREGVVEAGLGDHLQRRL